MFLNKQMILIEPECDIQGSNMNTMNYAKMTPLKQFL